MVEQRVMAGARKPVVSAKGTSGAAEESSASGGKDGKKKGKGRKLLLVVLIVGLVGGAGGGAYWYAKHTSDPAVIAANQEKAEEAAKPKPGELVEIESKSLNLADGHYLRLGMSVQFDDQAGGGGHGGDVSTAAISAEANKIFSQKSVAQLADPNVLEGLRQQLIGVANEQHYSGHIIDIYLTDFVTQ